MMKPIADADGPMQLAPSHQFRAEQEDICVLLNGGSGKYDTEAAAGEIRAAFAASGREAKLRVLDKGSDILPAARAALEQGFATIVAAGGDGTISAVASVLRGSGVTMGVIPLGTFNYFARSLDIPLEIPAAVALLTQGTARPVRVATINDRLFLNNASLGAYPAILKTREDVYRKWGRSRAAAYWSVLVALVTLRKPLHLTIEAAGQKSERRTPLIFAVNNAFQLEQLGLQGREDIAAGRLAMFIAPDTSRWGMLRNAVLLALGLAEKDQNFDLVAAERITITDSGRSYDIACDGERGKMRAPYTLKVIEDELTVIAPHARKDDLR